jgi:hypothetical protein
MLKSTVIPPGTVVQIKNLKKNSELNGQFGLVKKLHSENRYRVMLALNTKNEMAIKTENFTVQNQCPNECKSNFTGVIIWPGCEAEEYPVVQWLDWPQAKRNLKIWVEECRENTARISMPAVLDITKKQEMAGHLHEYLGWCFVANRSQFLPRREQHKIYYEEQHVGTLNKWYKNTFNIYIQTTGSVAKNIRGPIILLQNMHDDTEKNMVSLNYHRANFSVMKHFYETYDKDTNEMMSFDDFSAMMQEKLVCLYQECRVLNCKCKLKQVYTVKFEKRIKNQYDLLTSPLTEDENGMKYGIKMGSRMKFDHAKKEFKMKFDGVDKYTKTPLDIANLKINEGLDLPKDFGKNKSKPFKPSNE